MKVMTESYLLDTYALVEISKGNGDYARYMDYKLITTKLNLMELYYALLRDFDVEKADKFYDFFLKFVVEIEDRIIKDAMIFRLANKKKNLSYIDCLGYIVAVSNGIKFLTGDSKFRHRDNVEFVR